MRDCNHVAIIVDRVGGNPATLDNFCGDCGERIVRENVKEPWIAFADSEPKLADPDRVNVYVCQKCGGFTVTIDIHEGVTPFTLRCRASGKEGKCGGMAYSSFYPKGPRPAHIPPPTWEWFSPRGSDYRKLNEAMREHVDKGGLDIRLRAVTQ